MVQKESGKRVAKMPRILPEEQRSYKGQGLFKKGNNIGKSMKYVGYLPILVFLPIIKASNLTWQQLADRAKLYPRCQQVLDNYRNTCISRQIDNSKRLYKRVHK